MVSGCAREVVDWILQKNFFFKRIIKHWNTLDAVTTQQVSFSEVS
ncbi:hypothetical protein RLOC_00013626 [Lonchura striata]|uniref:Uncharacterized protein n=1 Tax=Lonchura striata TaxID=40157 RepID=A0A218VE69_9PASE|nr:hypothetical protein RLOC_00013626 [Lonchura striata domestica]